jgi:hypothetical protein
MALANRGIPSLTALLNQAVMSSGRTLDGEIVGTIFDGRASTLIHAPSRLNTNDYLYNNRGTVGATTGAVNSRAIFLGYSFFDPSMAGVPVGFYLQAQAIILLHESVHAFGGLSDQAFGVNNGSQALSRLITDACAPVLGSGGRLGRLY